jgi:hypothetical protein
MSPRTPKILYLVFLNKYLIRENSGGYLPQ